MGVWFHSAGDGVQAAPVDTYTHGHADAVLRSHRWRTAENSAGYLLPSLRPGLDVLDVGCGPGTITVDLARRVAPGRVLGLDVSPAPLDEARALAAGLRDTVATTSAWCYASPAERQWWGTSWAGRATASSFAEQAVAYGLASAGELAAIADAWQEW